MSSYKRGVSLPSNCIGNLWFCCHGRTSHPPTIRKFSYLFIDCVWSHFWTSPTMIFFHLLRGFLLLSLSSDVFETFDVILWQSCNNGRFVVLHFHYWLSHYWLSHLRAPIPKSLVMTWKLFHIAVSVLCLVGFEFLPAFLTWSMFLSIRIKFDLSETFDVILWQPCDNGHIICFSLSLLIVSPLSTISQESYHDLKFVSLCSVRALLCRLWVLPSIFQMSNVS